VKTIGYCPANHVTSMHRSGFTIAFRRLYVTLKAQGLKTTAEISKMTDQVRGRNNKRVTTLGHKSPNGQLQIVSCAESRRT